MNEPRLNEPCSLLLGLPLLLVAAKHELASEGRLFILLKTSGEDLVILFPLPDPDSIPSFLFMMHYA